MQKLANAPYSRRGSDSVGSRQTSAKRAQDREAQRASRAKAKAYVADLEKTIARLCQSQGGHTSSQTPRLLHEQTLKTQKLESCLRQVQKLASDAIELAPSDLGENSLSPDRNNKRLKYDVVLNQETQASLHGRPCFLPARPHPTSLRRTPSVFGLELICKNSSDSFYTMALNDAIMLTEEFASPELLTDVEEDQDILIRAVLCGWDAAESIHQLDEVWRFLRAFDEGLWSNTWLMERMAHLWQMRSTFLFKIQRNTNYRRPTLSSSMPTLEQQSKGKGLPIVDYFVWPHVRNSILQQGIANISGEAVLDFVDCFRFYWPFESRDAYKVNLVTGNYSFTHDFLKHFVDLSSYQMVFSKVVPAYCHPSLNRCSPSLINPFDTNDSAVEELGQEAAIASENNDVPASSTG